MLKVLTEQDTPLFSGMLATVLDNDNSIQLTYKGGKISKEVWDKVKSFLQWTQVKYKGESQLRLFYNRELRVWDAHPFEQYISTSLSTNEVKDSDLTKKIIDWYLSRGYENMGTVHHHCTAGAFQSPTDYADEIKQNGLHITLGHMESPVFDWHSRATLRGVLYTISLVEWFEDDVDLVSNIGDDKFPEDWKNYLTERVIPALPSFPKYGHNHYNREWYSAYEESYWERYNYTKKPAAESPKNYTGEFKDQKHRLIKLLGVHSADEFLEKSDDKDVVTMVEYLEDLIDSIYALDNNYANDDVIQTILSVRVFYNILNSCYRAKRKQTLDAMQETLVLLEEIASNDVDLDGFFDYLEAEVDINFEGDDTPQLSKEEIAEIEEMERFTGETHGA